MEKLINNIIHYEENIFYLKLYLNNIRKIESLNINGELFQKKIKDDLIFIDKTGKILMEHLFSNDKLLKKNDHFHSLSTLKKVFITEIETLISKNFVKSGDFSEIVKQNLKDIEVIDNLLDQLNKDSSEDLTTNEELNILFMDDNKDDEE